MITNSIKKILFRPFWNVVIAFLFRFRLLNLALIQEDDDAIDPPFTFLRFFFFAVKDSWPLSVLESLSESSSLELEEDELELLELSDAIPVLSSRFT